MTIFPAIAQGFSRWIDCVSDTVATLLGWVATPRIIKLSEDESGEFVLQRDERTPNFGSTPERIRIVGGQPDHAMPTDLATALSGSRVELILRPDRFLFRPIELPSRATEFLNGIVRTQIDRLTPWNAADAAFGWSKPVEASADRMVITVAATALALVRPYVDTIAGIGAQSIAVYTSPPEALPEAAPIKVWEERTRGAQAIGRIRYALMMILAVSGIAAGVAVGASAIINATLDAEQDEIARQIVSIRAAAGAARNATLGSTLSAQRTLEQRKHDAPSTVMVLEALSQILPDHTYVTELRVADNKLRLVGITQDSPSLIGLIEQSGRFTRATFFAPTTRSSSDPGERFHIEAVIQPLVASPS